MRFDFILALYYFFIGAVFGCFFVSICFILIGNSEPQEVSAPITHPTMSEARETCIDRGGEFSSGIIYNDDGSIKETWTECNEY